MERDPDKASYACHETVTLTAEPAPDWTFTGWSGALTGAELVKTIILTKSESVTATFTNPTPYALNVEVVSNGPGVGGTVTKNPDTPTYLYGTEAVSYTHLDVYKRQLLQQRRAHCPRRRRQRGQLHHHHQQSWPGGGDAESVQGLSLIHILEYLPGQGLNTLILSLIHI